MDTSKEKTLQGLLMELVHNYFLKAYNQMEKYALHPGQAAVIKEVGKNEGMSQRELADALHIKPPTVAVSIKRMEKGGFLERKADEKDQRVTRIYLTDYGREIYDELTKLFKENEKALFQGFEEGEIYLFKRFCKQIIQNIHDTMPENAKQPEMPFGELCRRERK